ncbi:hypothetical protein GGR50DRAFT_376423 [Xylaria sp. CBS 124048]|nr:hypothetical protein GGR50DRAFT_376423 [Xylaria sp. CBS 124048]
MGRIASQVFTSCNWLVIMSLYSGHGYFGFLTVTKAKGQSPLLPLPTSTVILYILTTLLNCRNSCTIDVKQRKTGLVSPTSLSPQAEALKYRRSNGSSDGRQAHHLEVIDKTA